MSITNFAVPCLLLAAVAGPASAAETLPDAIAASGETVVLSVHAEGAQVYECKAGTDGKLAWAFREPIATLFSDGKTIGRHYAGKVTQVISGSIGFDDWEWGVDLFAHDPLVFKKLIYEMRFDEASAKFAEFGPFYTGIQFAPGQLGEYLNGQVPSLNR